VDHQENPLVPGVALQVHGDPEKQRRESLMLLKMSYLTYICSLEMKQEEQLPPAVESIMQGYMSCMPQSMT
jgi:hypothetical protein